LILLILTTFSTLKIGSKLQGNYDISKCGQIKILFVMSQYKKNVYLCILIFKNDSNSGKKEEKESTSDISAKNWDSQAFPDLFEIML
jgi:hypothetical protein